MRLSIFLYVLFLPIVAFGQAVESDIGNEGEELGPSEKAGSFYQNAVQLYGEARYRESINAFGRAIQLDPQSVYFCNRAVVLLQIGEVPKSLKDFEACEKSFIGEKTELATINSQRIGVQSGIEFSAHARHVSNQILADNLYVPAETGWSLTSWGLLSLGLGAGLIGSAITIDFLSEDLVSEFVTESEGRPGTDQARHDELKGDVQTRQILFYGLSIGGTVLSVLGLSLIIADLGGEDDKMALGLELKANGATLKISF